jgi:taurine dioxygenase
MTGVEAVEIRTTRLAPSGVSEVHGIDAARIQDPATISALWSLLSRQTVLVLRNQSLTPGQHVAFSRQFGDLDVHIKRDFTLPGHPEVFVLSNIVENGRAIGVTNFAESWHADGTQATNPPVGALLYAVEVPPEGAETQFANMYTAYDELDDQTKQSIERLSAIHSYHALQAHLYPDKSLPDEVKAATPDRPQAIVRTHPATGLRSLLLGAEIVVGIEGYPEPSGTSLMTRLLAHATQPRFVYTHKWRTGDLVMWDNRCTLHRVLPFDQQRFRRRMHRTTLVSDSSR